MRSLFQSYFSRPVISYQTEQWSARLGDQCKFCNKRLTHQKCLSLCKCYYFCHQNCFQQQFQKQIYDEKTIVKCSKCDSELALQYNMEYQYKPSLNLSKGIKSGILFILMLLIFLIMNLTIRSSLSVQTQFIICYFEGLVFTYISYEFALSIRNILYHKIIKISNIVSTKLDIQTSAFKDIQLETNDELTKDYLQLSNKK